MKIHIRAICPEILGALKADQYILEDGLSAIDALTAAMELNGMESINKDTLSMLVYMKNGKHITSDTVLTDGDSLMALRPVYGG